MKPPPSQLVMGVHTLETLLKNFPEKILAIYTLPTKTGPLLDLAKKHKIPITFLSDHLLSKMVLSDSHQGLVAHVRQREFLSLDSFFQKAAPNALVLMLDQIFDPQNMGALIRSAECFGVDALIWSKNRGTEITPVVSKASSGASEMLPLIRVSNLATSLDAFKKEGFEVVASLLDESSESAYEFNYSSRTVLIMGSEAEGIQPLLKRKADRSIYLPMMGSIQSLNVAQACASLLALLRRARPG